MRVIRNPKRWPFVSVFVLLLLISWLGSTRVAQSYEEDPGGNTIPAAGEIIGFVFEDIDGDGERDEDESALGSTVTVSLLNLGADGALGGGDDSVLATTPSFPNGFYVFTGLTPGTYGVQVADVSGFQDTSLNPALVIVGASGAEYHFGKLPTGTISGVVFNDLNGNGVRDSGESGIDGVTLTLDGATTTSTTATGFYAFTGVAAGLHTVVETDPPNTISTTANTVTVVLAPGGIGNASFGDLSQGPVSGTGDQGTLLGAVFNDLNGNGVQDEREPGIGGVFVILDGVQATTTSSSGLYRFDGVPSGAHTLVEADPADFVSTTPNTRAIFLTSGGMAAANFGDQARGSISGVVFNDSNGNGYQDVGEPGIGNVILVLKEAATGTSLTLTTTTSVGAYTFSGVGPGVYTVSETDPTGFTSTTPNERTVYVGAVVVSAADLSSVVNQPAGDAEAASTSGAAIANFGDQAKATISGRVFQDRNGNMLQDVGEPGVAGVQVTLDGTTVTTTTGNGSYLFSNVAVGVHTVVETDPAGYVSTTPNARGVLVPLSGAATVNFGVQEQGTVFGSVFNDLNGDGIQNRHESGISGVVITLVGGGPQRTTTTDPDGVYIFRGENPGNRLVRETDPAGFASSTPNTEQIFVPASGSVAVAFGDRLRRTISGVVFNDLNGNTVQDTDEVGIGGVTVTLDGATTATTAGNGVYIFPALDPGPHTVVESDPSGYVSTTPNIRSLTMPASGSGSANFGDQQQGIIAGTVFHDRNGDGLRDTGESGIDGVVVSLNRTITTTTSGGGHYVFVGVAAGQHDVIEIDPNGFTSTTRNSRTVSVAANGSATADFGDQLVRTISGVVFMDIDGDEFPDPSEARLGDAEVQLLQEPGLALLATTRSSADGSFLFTDVGTGAYLVRCLLPSGYTFVYEPPGALSREGSAVAQGEKQIVLPVDGTGTAMFSSLPSGSISGVVFNDLNRNGSLDADEQPLNGATLSLLNSAGRIIDTQTSSGDGQYLFAVEQAGSYRIAQTPVDGFIPVVQDSPVLLTTNTGAGVANFPNLPVHSISGKVFLDSNNNRTQDRGEDGIGGVRITLNGTRTTTTTGNGFYIFTDVDPGTHTVVETDPSFFSSTTPNQVPVTLSAGRAAAANFGDTQVSGAGNLFTAELWLPAVSNGSGTAP